MNLRAPSVILCLAFLAAAPVMADVAVEPFTYSEDFEIRELSAWASYPPWQDTAYDPNMRVNTMVPGDPNISIEQKVTPYTSVDNYAGAMKELDMYMGPGNTITLRYYLKTNLPVDFIKVRIAAGDDGKLDVTVPSPDTNGWRWLTVGYDDFIRENPAVAGRGQVKVNAVAVLTRIPDADPAMPIYLGIDDVTFKGLRATAFQFDEPSVHKLSEWKPYIAASHYTRGDDFTIKGHWPLDADRVTCRISVFTDPGRTLLDTTLRKRGDTWELKPLTLSWEPDLYRVTLTALNGDVTRSRTELTFYIAPDIDPGVHPRVWFDADKKAWVDERLASDRFASILEGFRKSAPSSREQCPIESVVFDIDQFLDEKWLIGDASQAWFSKVSTWGSAIHNNAFAYAFDNDTEAGLYAKDLMVRISELPYWLHPWFIKRGRHIYYPLGLLGMNMALGYDLTYDLMTEDERRTVRAAMLNNIVIGCHKGYVEDDLVTSNTSNWVGHITGGSLMCLAAYYGDGPDVSAVEPYFTGAIFKMHQFTENVIGRDGSQGEGYGYYNFSSHSWSHALPAVENVFNVDMSAKLNGSYKEIIWAGIVKEKETYYFGDSRGTLGPLTNWAWLLPKYRDPLLGWFYNYMKTSETFMDVLYETEDVPRDDPFDEEPVRFFTEIGTTVFKSGWEPDDFVFVMRTGPFVNHQHLDQGTFWLSDRGSLFIEERHGSTYYKDPNYQPWYTQPVAHSTILIDGNHQSQRVGDVATHVDGFDDYAFLADNLNGDDTAFAGGDIGRLYWGQVDGLQRNVLYLKPRTILMLDTVEPADRDVDVTLLYQTRHLKDITASSDCSTITIDENTLFIDHVWPRHVVSTTVETPHYLSTLLNEKPLVKEGMLTVTARTNRIPLVMANVLTSTTGERPDVALNEGNGCMVGTVAGRALAFTTRPGRVYDVSSASLTTDALAVTWDRSIFAAKCTTLLRDGDIIFQADKPVTFERRDGAMKLFAACETVIRLGVDERPGSLDLNGTKHDFSHDSNTGVITFTVPAGRNDITIK